MFITLGLKKFVVCRKWLIIRETNKDYNWDTDDIKMILRLFHASKHPIHTKS